MAILVLGGYRSYCSVCEQTVEGSPHLHQLRFCPECGLPFTAVADTSGSRYVDEEQQKKKVAHIEKRFGLPYIGKYDKPRPNLCK